MRKTKEKNKGITLIALVITIIILLILAGVTIATLTGDNGLIDKTSEAQFRTEIAQFQEELDLSIIKEEGKNKRGRTNTFNATSYDDIKKIIPSFNKKYEDSLAIEEDKLVYKGNNKELYKLSYEMGLIPEDDLLDDEILEELQPFITEWTVEAGDSITLPIDGTCNFIVNYGDGTEDFKVTSSTDEDRIHTYTTAGTYTVTIKGNIKTINSRYYGNETINKLKKIVQWGTLQIVEIKLWSASNLVGPLPEPSKNSFINLSNVEHMFYGCKSLNCEIPEKLFYNCPKIKKFDFTFSNCNFIGEIPEKLFSKCPNVTSFNSCFRENSSVTGPIPENLFKYNTEVVDFSYTFRSSGVKGNLPKKLFDNNTKATKFTNCFHGRSGLTGEAPELWKRNNITSYNQCFYGCTNLSNYNDIPSTWK